MDITEYKVNYGRFSASIYYEKEITEEDIMLKNKQISDLEASITRRKNLLSNENYLNKAPKELVEKKNNTLKDEEEKLAKLKKLLDEVSKITDIKGYDDELMFTPSSNKAKLREDEVGDMISAKEALANAPKKNGNFVEVPVMINE